MKQIICVHMGDRYSDEYLHKLLAGVRRHGSADWKFTVISDRRSYTVDDIRFRTVSPHPIEGCSSARMWWYKMQAFRPDIAAEENLLIDIDVVITGDLNKLWDYEIDQFVICQDFNRQWVPNYPLSNSSVVRFTKKHAETIYAHWQSDPRQHMREFRGDQDYMDAHIKNMKNWPRNWIMSWKWEVYKGGQVNSHDVRYKSEITVLDPDTSMLVFHGKPDPHEVDDEAVSNIWNK